MKVTIEIPGPTITQEVEVAFPLFCTTGDTFDSGDSYDTFYRIDSSGGCHWVTIRRPVRGPEEFELGWREVRARGGNLRTYLQYEKIAPAVFYKAVDQLQQALADIPTGVDGADVA